MQNKILKVASEVSSFVSNRPCVWKSCSRIKKTANFYIKHLKYILYSFKAFFLHQTDVIPCHREFKFNKQDLKVYPLYLRYSKPGYKALKGLDLNKLKIYKDLFSILLMHTLFLDSRNKQIQNPSKI